MVSREFYDRKRELALFNEKYARLSSGEMIVLYGRRRVGKTELIRQFLKTVSNNKLYFYVDLTERQGILDSLSRSIHDQVNETVRFSEFDDFFDYIETKSEKETFVLVIDEFQRFLDVAPDFITKIQNHWDSRLKYKKVIIALVGSSIGMIQKITNSKAGALYGRATRIKISPFSYADFRLMFRESSEEDKVVIYSVFGGTPYYLEKVRPLEGDIYQKILHLILKNGAELMEEPKNLLEYEHVRIHAKYNAILQAASSGKETLKEIEDFTKINANIIPAYIAKLDGLLDLLGRKDPVLGKERLGRYGIRDNFFRFWYRFVFPNQTALNLGNTKLVLDLIRENLNAYVGRVFEDIVKELLVAYQNKKINNIEINFENIGSWWDRTGNEIDIVAYNKKERKILVGEVKWTSQPMDVDVVEELIIKSKLIDFSGEYTFLLASKNGFTERCVTKMDALGAIYINLKDISALFDKL